MISSDFLLRTHCWEKDHQQVFCPSFNSWRRKRRAHSLFMTVSAQPVNPTAHPLQATLSHLTSQIQADTQTHQEMLKALLIHKAELLIYW